MILFQIEKLEREYSVNEISKQILIRILPMIEQHMPNVNIDENGFFEIRLFSKQSVMTLLISDHGIYYSMCERGNVKLIKISGIFKFQDEKDLCFINKILIMFYAD
jgi:hypothetical protein